jgi:hypothetical protein
MKWQKILIWIGLLLLSESFAIAQNTGAGNGTAQSAQQKLADLVKPVVDFFGKPLHPTVSQVAPGGGISAGVGFTPAPWCAGTCSISLRASGSVKQYWVLDANATYQAGNRFHAEAYGHARHMTELPFFGIGDQTIITQETDFRYQERTIGGMGWVRFVPWLALGSRLEQLWPSVGSGFNSSVPSIGQRFTELSAPGLTAQPAFTRYQGFVDFNYPAAGLSERRGTDIKIAYNVFHDDDNKGYSFRRVEAEGREHFSVWGPDRKLTFHGLVSMAQTDAGQNVPFYLQETLGGATNLLGFHESLIGGDESIATLRGYRDFRFRDRDLVLLQTEFRQKLWGPIDISAFTDAGKVARTSQDLGLTHLRHDFGVSLSLMRGPATVARFDFAFGGAEGTHGFLSPGRVIGQ